MSHSPLTRPAAEAQPPPGELLEELFARCQDELLGTLYYLLGNVEDAHDALQEAFLKCWRHRAEVPDVLNLRAWVFRVVLNTGRDLRATAWRRRRRPIDQGASELIARDPEPAADAARAEQLGLVRQALTDLRAEEQEVFLLRQNGRMTYDQIAESINLPVGTVKTRMRLALGKLRAALEPKPDA
jgi:RNA polymerase sigma factor (sigma-70 family)